MNISTFNSLPGNAWAYWASKNLIKAYQTGSKLEEIASPKKGLSTGDNDRFFRFWFEVSFDNTCFDATDYIFAMYTGKKWFPINKGGLFRKWYGNNEYLVNYQNNGRELQNFSGSIIRNPNYYFGESLTWTDLSTGSISVRYNKKGFIHDVAGPCIFELKTNNNYLLGLLNSKTADDILALTSSTLHFNVGDIALFPVYLNEERKNDVETIVSNNVRISKNDWDSFENSWDFKRHPLI